MLTLTFDDGVVREGHNLPNPEHIPTDGDRYEVLIPFVTKGGIPYEKGDILQIIGRTDEAPFNWKMSNGNLIVVGKDGKNTVWSTIELMVLQKIIAYRVRH